MNKTDLIKVTNRDSGRVGYKIDELGVRRQFAPRETKEITFEELEKLSYLPGGSVILKDYLIVKDAQAMKELGLAVEPEYYYTEKEVKELLTKGTMDEFLDCLDFAPDGVIDLIKDLSVSLPLNDVEKREAIYEKTGFNVTNAIAVKNTKFDGETEAEGNAEAPKRRAAVPAESATGQIRRVQPKRVVVPTKE